MTPSEVLEKAAAIVDERWCQGGPGCPGGPRCAYGAIEEITDPLGDWRLALATRTAADRATGILGGIVAFNDAPGRTKEEVAAKLREAAAKAREAGQ